MERKQIQRNVFDRIKDLVASLKPEGKVKLWNAFAKAMENDTEVVYDECTIVPVILESLNDINAMTFSKLRTFISECADRSTDPYWFTYTAAPFMLRGSGYNRPPVDQDKLVCFLLTVCSAVKYDADKLDDGTLSIVLKGLVNDCSDVDVIKSFVHVLLLGYTVNELSSAFIELNCDNPLKQYLKKLDNADLYYWENNTLEPVESGSTK